MSLIKIRAALQTALDSMPGIVPAVGIGSVSSAGVVVTTQAHGLKTGLSVTITGHSTANGTYNVSVLSSTSVQLLDKVKDIPVPRTAGGAGGVLRANLTAWEGVAFKPLAGVPYQRVNLMPAEPWDVGFGDRVRQESGIMQVTLCYPVGEGTYDATVRAELIRETFKRGSVFSNGGVDVKILKTPSVVGGLPNDESYWLPVLIEYHADIIK